MTSDFAIAWAVMKWPLAACLVLPPLLVYLGLHVVRREVIFVDLALAQVATMGTCIALIMGFHFGDITTFWISLGVTFVAAALFSWSRSVEKHEVPQEAIIGITFVVAAAAVILLLSRVAGGKEGAAHRWVVHCRSRQPGWLVGVLQVRPAHWCGDCRCVRRRTRDRDDLCVAPRGQVAGGGDERLIQGGWLA